ncbi:unnamed protein product [Symbiodinium natans]|uniref:Uncharacterized protein n=1 Tax=Symbiodinium natans TaxID=878477 RepID=A0A812SK00_9DINO|nr:unnamed protein product [Symbiodinium natans]
MGQHCCGSRPKQDWPVCESRSPPPQAYRKSRAELEDDIDSTVSSPVAAAKGITRFGSEVSADGSACTAACSSLSGSAVGFGIAGQLLAESRLRRAEECTSPTKDVPLTEEGYRHLANIRDKEAMTSFAQRLVEAKGGRVDGHGAQEELEGIAAWHSSGRPLASFDLLEDELERAAWAGIPPKPVQSQDIDAMCSSQHAGQLL